MGVSFKVARTGWRYRSRLPESGSIVAAAASASVSDDGGEDAPEAAPGGDLVLGKRERESFSAEECEASFSINLYAHGFSIGKPAEGMFLPLVQDVPKMLHPYDRTALTLFSAIKNGWFPGDILDDIPCKYHNGTIICEEWKNVSLVGWCFLEVLDRGHRSGIPCHPIGSLHFELSWVVKFHMPEVWDFRTLVSKMGDIGSLTDDFPIFQKVQLKMCMENVIKDVPSISNDSWTYKDLLQAESRIMKALQPVLYLDPTPSLNRLCASPISTKIDLQMPHGRPKVTDQDELAVDMKSSNIFYEGDTSRNEIFKSFMLLNAFGDGSRSCAEHSITGTKLNLHQHVTRENIPRDSLKMASRVNVKQEITPVSVSETVTGASSVLLSKKDLIVSCLGMSSEIPGKRLSDSTQPIPISLLKRQKIEHSELAPYKQVIGNTQLLVQSEVDKMKHQCHGKPKCSHLATSEPVIKVLSETQPDMVFYVNGRDIPINGILGHTEFQKHAFNASAMSYAQHTVPEVIVNIQQNNLGNCTMGHDFQIAPQKQFIATSISEALKVASSVSHSERDPRVSFPGMQKSATPAEKRQRSSHQQAPTPSMKRPKVEQLELTPHQMNTLVEHGQQQNSSLLLRQLEVGTMLHLRHSRQSPSQLEMGEQVFEDGPKSQYGMHFYSDKRNVKCEVKAGMVLSENLCGAVIGKAMENHLSHLNCIVPNQRQSLPFLTSHMHSKNPGPSIDRSSESDEHPQNVKQYLNYQILARGLSHSPESLNVGSHSQDSSLQVNATMVPEKRDFDYSLGDPRLSMKAVRNLENLDNINAPADAASPLIADLPVLPPLVTEVGNAVLNRFSKIKILTERYALNCRKNKKDEKFGRKAFSHSTQFLSELLNSGNAEENRHSMNESCVSKDFLAGSGSEHKTRILTFKHSEILHGEDGSLFTFFKPKRRLFWYESGEPDHEVEIWIIFGDSEQPIHFALLPNTHKAHIFVDQFTSLMEREGYKLEDIQLPLATISSQMIYTDCYQVSHQPFTTSISGQMMNTFANMDRCISTANIQSCPPQSTPSADLLLPPFYNLSRPQEVGICPTLPSMRLHHHQAQMSILLSQNHSSVGKELQMERHLFGRPAHLNASALHQWQEHKKQTIPWINIRNITGMRRCVSNLNNTGQIYTHGGPMYGFNSLNNQLFSKGISRSEMEKLANVRNRMRNTPDLSVGLAGTGSVLAHCLSKSAHDLSLCSGRFLMGLPLSSSMNLDISNYNLLQNHRGCISNLSNMGQINNGVGPTDGFSSLNHQLFSGRTSEMENTMRDTPDLGVGSSQLGQAFSRSVLDQSFCNRNSPVGFPMPSSMNPDITNYNSLQNQNQWHVQHHRQRQIELHHRAYSSLTNRSQQMYSIPVGCSSGVIQQQSGTHITNDGGPLSMQSGILW